MEQAIIKDLIIVGAGGFGREVFWLVEEINRVKQTWNVVGFLDDNPKALDGHHDFGRVLGNIEECKRFDHAFLVCAIGDPLIRQKTVRKIDKTNSRWATLIDPSVSIGTASKVGKGCVFLKRATVTVNADIGNHVHFGCSAQAGHDSQIADYCTICGHVDINGNAMLDEGAFLGSHACIMPGIHIGAWTRIGAGTVAIKNVPPKTTIFGVPGKNLPRTT